MQKNSFKLFIFLLASLFISSQSCIASAKQELTTAQYVDIAGQQRMLAHQTLVAYSQIGQIQSYGNPVNLKLRAIKDFEYNIELLKKNADLLILIDRLESTWIEFKKITLEIPDKSQMSKLIVLNEQILEMSNNLIKQLIKGRNSEMDIINISGQQRMLSQRIALFMLIENWGIKDNHKKEFTDSLEQFASNLIRLKNNKDNTVEINKRLKSVEHDYKKLIVILYKNSNDRDYSFTISRLTSQILRKSKKSTKLYVDLKS